MEKYLKYFIGILILFSFSLSQVTESIEKFSVGTHNALQIKLIDAEKKFVEDQWKNYVKSKGTTKKKKGEFKSTDIDLYGLSHPVYWYTKFNKDRNDIILSLCVVSNEEFLSSLNQSDNFAVIEDFLIKFTFVVEKAKTEIEFEEGSKKLTKLQNELKKLNKNYAKNTKLIDKSEKKIKKLTKENDSNLSKQEKYREQISKQQLTLKDYISSSSDSLETDTESKNFEDENIKLLKNQKKLEVLVGDYEDNLKSINKLSRKIEEAKEDNQSIIKKQEKIKEKISGQGKSVEQIRKQLEILE